MKYFYIAVTVEEETKDNKKGYYSYIIKVTESDNIKSKLEKIKGLIHANIFETKKKAAEVVSGWNNSYKINNNIKQTFKKASIC
jgi:hypothetical protein